MRNPLTIEPTYYDFLSAGKYSKFKDAVMDVGPSPCVRYNCSRFTKCAEEAVECFAFRIWVNNGGKLNEKQQAKMQTRMLPIK